MSNRTVEERVSTLLRRKTHRWPRCWSRVVRSYMAREERANCRMLFRRFGVKYWKEKKRLRVLYKIPWGVEFDVRNPGACLLAGTWNGPLELFTEIWKDSTEQEKSDWVETMIERVSPRRN
jgi:hypothetical protein